METYWSPSHSTLTTVSARAHTHLCTICCSHYVHSRTDVDVYCEEPSIHSFISMREIKLLFCVQQVTASVKRETSMTTGEDNT